MNASEGMCSIELPEDQLRGLKPGQSITLEIQATVESIEGETLNYTYEWAEVYSDDKPMDSEEESDEPAEEAGMMPTKKNKAKKASRKIPSALA